MSERSDNEHWYDEHAAPVLGWGWADGAWVATLLGFRLVVCLGKGWALSVGEARVGVLGRTLRTGYYEHTGWRERDVDATQLAAEDALADLCVETLRKLRPGALLENADPKACMAQFVSGSRENAEYLRRCLDSEPPMPTAAELLERHPEAAHPCAPMSEGTTLRTATVRTMYPRTCDRLTPAERDELNRLWKEDCSCSMGDRPPSPPAANTRRLLELEAKKRGGR